MRQRFLSIYAGLILAAMVAIVWFGVNITPKSSAGVDQNQMPQSINKEAMNIKKLNSLLEKDGVRVDDAALLPTQVEQSRTIQIRLQAAGANDFAGQMAENTNVSLIKVKNDAGVLSRQRFLELSPTLILVAAVNDQKQVLWWNLQPDPRIFRADSVDAEKQVTGKTFYRNDAEMLVSLPADKAITEVRFYQPVWDGKSAYSLKSIGNLSLNSEVNK